MKILTIDTSWGLHLGLLENNTIFGRYDNVNHNVADTLIYHLRSFLNNYNTPVEKIDYVFLLKGPGSFTSIRCAVMLGRMLKLLLKIPIFPLNSLDVLYNNFSTSQDVGIDSLVMCGVPLGSNGVGISLFDSMGNKIIDSEFLLLHELDNLLLKNINSTMHIVGDLQISNKYKNIVTHALFKSTNLVNFVKDINMLEYIMKINDMENLEPLYLTQPKIAVNTYGVK